MRYDDYDDYTEYSRGGSRGGSRSGSPYSRGREYERGGYDRDRGGSRYSSGRDYGGSREYSGREYGDRYDRGGYGSRYSGRDRGYESDGGYGYDRRSDAGYDRYGGRTRPRSSGFDPDNWNRTAPNWVDHSEPDPPPRRRSSSSGRGSDRDRRRSERPDYDRYDRDRDRRSSSGSRNSGRRTSGGRSRSGSGNRRRSASTSRRGINPIPIILVIVVIALAAILIHTFVGGGGGGSKYKIEFSNRNIVVGETAEATLNGLPSGSDVSVIWSSNDINVVSVSGDGAACTLTAKSTGQAVIAATIDGKTVDSGSVMVIETATGVEEIRLAQEEVSVVSGSEYTIQATVIMEKEDMTPAKISWSSSDPSIAKVSDGGIVTAGQVGQTIIKGTAGQKTCELVITVTENTNNNTFDASQVNGQRPEEGAESTETDAADAGAVAGGDAAGETGNTAAETEEPAEGEVPAEGETPTEEEPLAED